MTKFFKKSVCLLNDELNFLGIKVNSIDLICILLFIGAMGKSAQFFSTHLAS